MIKQAWVQLFGEDEVTIKRNETRTMLQQCDKLNILMVGEHQHGKSCMTNTVYRALTTHRVAVALPGTGQPTTRDFRRHTADAAIGVNLFDMTGFKYTTDLQKYALCRILAGVDTCRLSFRSERALLRDVNAMTNNEDNAIDFVVFVVKASDVQERRDGWFGPSFVPNDQSRRYFQDLHRLIQNHTRLHYPPVIAFTHMDQCRLSHKTLQDHVFNWLAGTEKYYFHCYTNTTDNDRSETDKEALRLLQVFATRKSTTDSFRLRRLGPPPAPADDDDNDDDDSSDDEGFYANDDMDADDNNGDGGDGNNMGADDAIDFN